MKERLDRKHHPRGSATRSIAVAAAACLVATTIPVTAQQTTGYTPRSLITRESTVRLVRRVPAPQAANGGWSSVVGLKRGENITLVMANGFQTKGKFVEADAASVTINDGDPSDPAAGRRIPSQDVGEIRAYRRTGDQVFKAVMLFYLGANTLALGAAIKGNEHSGAQVGFVALGSTTIGLTAWWLKTRSVVIYKK